MILLIDTKGFWVQPSPAEPYFEAWIFENKAKPVEERNALLKRWNLYYGYERYSLWHPTTREIR